MNERIKELAVQAGYGSRWNTTEQFEQFMEKFAQLIVAECGVALSPMLRDMISRGQAHDLIKQHFGVEQ